MKEALNEPNGIDFEQDIYLFFYTRMRRHIVWALVARWSTQTSQTANDPF